MHVFNVGNADLIVDIMSRAFGASSAVWLVCLCPVSAGACRYQLARTSVPFPARRGWPIYWPQGAGELRTGELRTGEVGVGEVGVGEVGAGEVRAIEIRAGKPGAAEVCAAKVRADELRGEQIRPGEDRMGEHRAGEVRAGEVRAGEVRACQVNRAEVAPGKPPPDHGDGCLNVGPRRSFPGPAAGMGWRPVLA